MPRPETLGLNSDWSNFDSETRCCGNTMIIISKHKSQYDWMIYLEGHCKEEYIVNMKDDFPMISVAKYYQNWFFIWRSFQQSI